MYSVYCLFENQHQNCGVSYNIIYMLLNTNIKHPQDEYYIGYLLDVFINLYVWLIHNRWKYGLLVKI